MNLLWNFHVQSKKSILNFLESGFIGGYDLGIDYGFDNQMLIAVTEQRTKEEIDQFVEALEAVVNG